MVEDPQEIEMTAEERLWRAVLMQYVVDVTMPKVPQYVEKAQQDLILEARNDWRGDRKQLERICVLAGLDHHWVVEKLATAINKGTVSRRRKLKSQDKLMVA